MNILITGSKGFIGSELVLYFESKGYNIFQCDRKDNFEVQEISESYLLSNNIEVVFHLAAQTSVQNNNISLIEKDNIQAFLHIYELSKKLNIKFIYSSSSCSYNITSMYGLTKHFIDNYIDLYPYNKCIILRLHNVYGKNARENTLLGICKKQKKIILYNNGDNTRHFTYIEDVCKSFEKALMLNHGLYNVVNPEETSIIDFVNEVKQYIPTMEIIITSEKRERDKERQYVDLTKINLIESNATNLKEGLKKSFENE